jgi:hypothetical protein
MANCQQPTANYNTNISTPHFLTPFLYPTTPISHSFITIHHSNTPISHFFILIHHPISPIGHYNTPIGHFFSSINHPNAPIGHTFSPLAFGINLIITLAGLKRLFGYHLTFGEGQPFKGSETLAITAR